ncbi:MAG TPA: TetR/AcrR family transcriptional regulator [Acidimicrobiales bacterium]|nr:TetR/AcrR family transcriptional regulator [Acidimicrobiales bacterium]
MAEGDVRAELLAAGERVFASRGYAAATVDDVVKSSATSRASFYRYFVGKEQLFEELSRACFREMRDALRSFAAGEGPPGRSEITALLTDYQALNDRYGGVIRAWTELTGPAASPMHDRGVAAVQAMFDETGAALQRAGMPRAGPTGAGATGAGPTGAGAERAGAERAGLQRAGVPADDAGCRQLRTRAALLFLLIEGSSFYVSNRVSRVDPDRLPPTLATLVERAYVGTGS